MSDRPHRIHPVHRLGGAILGMVLLAYGAAGYARGLALTGETDVFWGLSNNGALAIASVIAGLLLVVGAAWGGPAASTLSVVVGLVFAIAGLAHLAIINTSWNVLEFRLSSTLFCLVAGLLALFLGFYGRVSGGLPPENPYRRNNPIKRHRPDPDEQIHADRVADERSMQQAELAVAEGTATPEQARAVHRERARKQTEQRQEATRRAEERRGKHGPQ